MEHAAVFSLGNGWCGGQFNSVEILSHLLLLAAWASVFQERKGLTLAAFLGALGVTALTLRLHITVNLPLHF